MKFFIPVSDEIPYDDPLFSGETLIPYCVDFSCCRGVRRLRNESAAVDEARNTEVSDDE